MLRVTARFPLGVYHARSASEEAEWPPSPLRLIGALLAATHERPSAEPEPDRLLLQRLCGAPAPTVIAPESAAVGEPTSAGEAVRLRGATRWAPRNYVSGPISPRNVGRERAEVNKSGVALGDRRVTFVWPDLDLTAEDLERLAVLAGEVTFLGTTRSPAILEVHSHEEESDVSGAGPELETWTPAAPAENAAAHVTIRVPDAQTIQFFDRRHAARRGRRERPEKAGMVPEIAIGSPLPYVSRRRRLAAAPPLDPRWWGEMIVLEIDRRRGREREGSELVPKAPAAYLLARAVRVTLLGAFDDAGTPEEAPPILRGRGEEPHCAIVPLPHVWGAHPDGLIRGVAILPPHETREPGVYRQLEQLERGLRPCLEDGPDGSRRYVQIPGAGRIYLKPLDAVSAGLVSLRENPYLGPARSWVSVTPVVHSRWRKGGIDALLEQVGADCAHVGLPAPIEIELLRGAGRRGGADRIPSLPPDAPESWRTLLAGPKSHLRITFPEPVRGPVLIGRARHFGLGLCVPEDAPQANGARS